MAEQVTKASDHFWEYKRLDELNKQEWEALCDGCGLCCLQKLQDEDTDEIFYTAISCRYLDIHACRCTVYEKRFAHLPECLNLTSENIQQTLPWLPPSCAYKRVYEGKPLAQWHPLVSGDHQLVHQQGRSVRHFAISESDIPEDDWQENLIDLLDITD
jgi:uncharacterized cysteine cluster protein YcgN (CxxCxxCC family)